VHGINEKCGKQNKLKVFGKAKVYQYNINKILLKYIACKISDMYDV
jgi:hypothetical protein